jgi:hypothetical protein
VSVVAERERVGVGWKPVACWVICSKEADKEDDELDEGDMDVAFFGGI